MKTLRVSPKKHALSSAEITTDCGKKSVQNFDTNNKTQSPKGTESNSYDRELEKQIKLAEKIMHKKRDLLKKLAYS